MLFFATPIRYTDSQPRAKDILRHCVFAMLTLPALYRCFHYWYEILFPSLLASWYYYIYFSRSFLIYVFRFPFPSLSPSRRSRRHTICYYRLYFYARRRAASLRFGALLPYFMLWWWWKRCFQARAQTAVTLMMQEIAFLLRYYDIFFAAIFIFDIFHIFFLMLCWEMLRRRRFLRAIVRARR